MSQIGRIYARYQESLEWAQEDFTQQRRRALETVRQWYGPFLRDLVIPYGRWFQKVEIRRKILRRLGEYFGEGKETLPFVAIDGTGNKRELTDMMVFYGAAYAQAGELGIRKDAERLRYRRWDPAEDTSFVAYLPIPLNALSELEREDWLFRADDRERAAAVAVHTQLMLLAEVYLAYRFLKQDTPPKIVLFDHSLSSLLLSTDVMHLVHPYRADKATLGWIDAYIPAWGRPFEPLDALVAHAHPMHKDLDVPSLRSNALLERLVAEMSDFWRIGQPGERSPGKPVRLMPQRLAGTTFEQLLKRIQRAREDFPFFELADASPERGLHLHPRPMAPTLRQRWRDLQRLFEDTCENLFRSRRLDALKLQYPQGSPRQGHKWMDSDDLRFLIGLGLRLLIELAWERHVLLIGIAKDSASRYFFKNFLSVMALTGYMDVPEDLALPGSDRLVAEMFPLVDETLVAPWSTLEYDAVFMTLRAVYDPDEKRPVIQGVRGDVLMPSDGLFARSLVHLFLERRPHKRVPLMGHVLFMDRLVYPYFDKGHRVAEPIITRTSRVRPLLWQRQDPNWGQAMSVLVADILTRNLFPEAIGQPDPLHRADMGAKALGRRIQTMLAESVKRFRQNPLAWRFRDYRDRRE